jgi:hypothetical protein
MADSDAELIDNSNFIECINICYAKDNIIYGTCNVIDFINNIECWAYNRSLDKKRVSELKQGILKTRTVHGLFTIAFMDNNYYLIDGQHRREAICQVIDKDDSITPTLLVAIYQVSSDDELIALFKAVNNSKPLSPKETPSSISIACVKMLSNDYKQAIRSKISKTIYPYVLAGDLQKHLERIILDNTTPKQLYTEVRKMNNIYLTLVQKNKKIPNMRKGVKCSILKAERSGFYLGLDEKWSWIERLQL